MCHHGGFGMRDLHRLQNGPAYARSYRTRVADVGVEVFSSAMITGWHGPRALSVTSPSGVSRIEAQAILLATGCREQSQAARLIPGNRPLGVFTTGSLQRFIYEHGVQVGQRAIIVGAELISLSSVFTLMHAGIAVAMMVTEHPSHQIYAPYLPAWWYIKYWLGVKLSTQSRVTRIIGSNRVEAVELTHSASGRVEKVACDTVVFTGNWIPENELARLGGLTLDTSTRGPRVDAALRTSSAGIFAAGNLVHGAVTADQAALEGRHAARSIARYLQSQLWPQSAIPIQTEPPILWVSPNCVTSGQEQLPYRHFLFQVNQFCRDVQMQIYQGNRLLYSQAFPRLGPNQSYALSGRWLNLLDHSGEPVHLALH
jgi:pyruvate/2-oxoglutarate dehydrogenase complex dihydrolipoamide dehydrogenase (E3) component